MKNFMAGTVPVGAGHTFSNVSLPGVTQNIPDSEFVERTSEKPIPHPGSACFEHLYSPNRFS